MNPIKRVAIVSTGTVRIRPEHVETNGTPFLWWLNTSRRWTDPLPINVYVIEHDKGLVLFDTGQDRRSVTDPGYFPGGAAGHIYRRLATFDVPSGATLTDRLREQGYDIADVRVAVLSHLHQDHIGGLRELPGSARILVHAAELAEVDKRFAAFAGLLREHIRVPGVSFTAVTPQRLDDPSIAPFTHAHDVMGDGSLLLLPTPGHTPGSMSLLLRGQGMPPMLLVGDVTYDVRRLAADRVPGVGDAARLHEVTGRVNALAARYPSMPILAAHDPAAAGLLASALGEHGTIPV
ncbi:MBL fold metallo-hydrolase [Micromonospora lupini]|uniref:MBL fold metallo-hydrolase n=1 Tax=Micromonospora lupini TaxID=285679 RepID=UPI00225AE900|nr:MBL fold metallo-hydrolase [Micromonospora lupini]MCX5066126.1 MBL fold metallo-hydrolase [Micromonospora lupini]